MASSGAIVKAVGRAKDIASKARPQVMGWLHGEFLQGMLSVARGLQGVIWHSSVDPQPLQILTAASRKVRCFSIILSIVSLLVVAILWLVAVCLLWILLQLIILFNGAAPWQLEVALRSLAFKYVLQTVVFIVPACTVMFLRYWAYDDQDKVFVAALQQEKLAASAAEQEHLHKLAGALQILPAESTWVWLKKYISAVARGSCVALGLMALSAVPWVGPMVYAVALVFKRGKQVGHVPTLALMTIALLPSGFGLPGGRLLSTWGLQSILTARSTAKELLYTMMSRATKGQKRVLHSQHHARITGFGVAAAAVLSIPIVGPLFWFDLVRLAAELLASIVASEATAVFDMEPAVKHFRLEQERKKQVEEQIAREREESALARRERNHTSS